LRSLELLYMHDTRQALIRATIITSTGPRPGRHHPPVRHPDPGPGRRVFGFGTQPRTGETLRDHESPRRPDPWSAQSPL